MTDLMNPMADESVQAAYWAMHHLPTPPEVEQAIKADSDLNRRRIDAGWPELSRDERRLSDRYRKVIEAHESKVLDAYRTKAAPVETKEQT